MSATSTYLYSPALPSNVLSTGQCRGILLFLSLSFSLSLSLLCLLTSGWPGHGDPESRATMGMKLVFKAVEESAGQERGLVLEEQRDLPQSHV